MKFYRKQKKLEAEPDSYRVVIKFLWFPKELDGITRWLETASILQQYSEDVFEDIPMGDYTWVDIEWRDLSKGSAY